MRLISLLLLSLCGSAYAAHPIRAEDAKIAMDMAKDHGCLSCHALNEKLVGPAYSKIADKYKDERDAAAGLVQSIKYGSSGKWGRIPMPPHPDMSDADLQKLARWVLSIEK